MDAVPGSPTSEKSLLSGQSLLLTVAALGIGCLLAVLWSFVSPGSDGRSTKAHSAKLEEQPSKGSKASKAKGSQSKAAASKAKASLAVAAVPAKPATPPPVLSASDVEVSDGILDSDGLSPQEEAPCPNAKTKKKKKRKPAKAEAGEEEAALEEAVVEPAEAGADVEEEEKIDGAALGLDGWTSVKKKKDADPEADEKTAATDKIRNDKVSDLRRRKAQIGHQIKRLEEGLSTNSKEEECKALEARSRLQEDLEKVNRSIQRWTAGRQDGRVGREIGRGAADASPAAESPEGEGGDENWQEGYTYDNGDQQWDHWDEWAGSTDWYSWGGGRGHHGRGGRGKGYSWEEEAGSPDGDWQDQEWWEGAAASASKDPKWVVKGNSTETKRQGRRPDAWDWQKTRWGDASWEDAGNEASTSSWQGAGSESWAGREWADDGAAWKRDRKPKGEGKKGRGKGEGKGDNHHRDNGDEHQDGPEGEGTVATHEEAAPSASGSPVPGSSPKGGKRDRKGKGKGKEGKDNEPGEGEDNELGEGKDSPKGGKDSKGKDSKGKWGKDSKGKGKGKNKKGKDWEDGKGMDLEDWLRQRGKIKDPKPSADQQETEVHGESADAESMRNAIAPLLARDSDGHRPNWGDAESSDEDRPAAVARQGRPAHLAAALKKSGNVAVGGENARRKKAEGDADVWDEDLTAFMSEDALRGDEAKFQEQLKYAPTWVRDKALRRRKKLMDSEG